MQNKYKLSKLLSQRGICSRREAEVLIAAGLVSVNNDIVTNVAERFTEDVSIELMPEAKKKIDSLVTILLNKPAGYVSAQPEDNYLPAVRLLKPENQSPDDNSSIKLQKNHFQKLAVAGRLDIDSRGLLVFTQDGSIARQLIGENSSIDKEYVVGVQGPLSDDALQRLRHGIHLDGKPLKPAIIEKMGPQQLRFILNEGRKRQIRRMCETVGLEVKSLIRIRVGQINLGRLAEGQWRFLGRDEEF